ncbi:hypothetical protein KSP40_PGU005760 [Platanthera guangdongensis]|uniref:ATP synthase alpha subunit C-terminal domain-containing protein n=1 Tax=Platanthera guangdongensis TaxID=2320717 RepID=A0ABR2LHY0_9ASPA
MWTTYPLLQSVSLNNTIGTETFKRTPNNLLGTVRSIWNTRKKYHSGNISNGVANGSVGSPIIDGSKTAKPTLHAIVPRITTGKIYKRSLGHASSPYASDLDKATQNQLARGQRLRELLKQSQSEPLAVEDQVAIIYIGTDGYLDVLEIGQVKRFIIGFRTYLTKNKPKFQEILSSRYKYEIEVPIL